MPKSDLVTKSYLKQQFLKQSNKLITDIEALIKLEIGSFRKEITQWREGERLRAAAVENKVDDHETRIAKLETSAT